MIHEGEGGHIEKGKYTGLRNRNFFYRLFNRRSYGLSMNEAASKLARLFRFANRDPREIVHRRFSFPRQSR